MQSPRPHRQGERGASAVEYAGLIVLAALALGALVILVGPQIGQSVHRAICTILQVDPCPGTAGPPRAQAPPQPTTDQARCVRDQRISYVEAQVYVRPRIVGGRGGLRWTSTTRVISHGPGRPDTYEVTLQSWKEGAVEAGLKGGGRLPLEAMAYIGLNATEGKTFTFGSKQEADDFEKTIPRYFIGGTAYDATKAAAGPVGTVLGFVDDITGDHAKNWAQGNPPKPQQQYEELGPTAAVELRGDIPLGGGDQASAGAKGRFWRLYGMNTNNDTGDKSYYLRQNNEIQPTVSINLGAYVAAFKGLAGKGLQSAIAKTVLKKTGKVVSVPPSVVSLVSKGGAAGLSLKWKPNTQYQVTVDKDGDLKRVTKVDDSILTWYAQGSLKGKSLGNKVKSPRIQGVVSFASSRTTETDTLDTNTPEERAAAATSMRTILLGNYLNPATPPTDDDLERAFADRGVKTRLRYDNDVTGGKADGQAYGVKGLAALELGGEDERDHLSGAEYWDPSSASWKKWTSCR